SPHLLTHLPSTTVFRSQDHGASCPSTSASSCRPTGGSPRRICVEEARTFSSVEARSARRRRRSVPPRRIFCSVFRRSNGMRTHTSEEHKYELQSRFDVV